MPSTIAPLTGRCALLDIEGTLADIRFVYDVMFPYIREHVQAYVQAHWGSPGFEPILDSLALDGGFSAAQAPWRSPGIATSEAIESVTKLVHRLMDSDSKTTGLKALQGVVWESGFRSGALRAEVFSDVLPAFQRWQRAGIDMRIYSSGSILAQKLFFGHTTQGDLTGYFSNHYDTTSGSKKEPSSYLTIAKDIGVPPEQIVFFTDVLGEIQAAREAGVQVVACVRKNNAPLPSQYVVGQKVDGVWVTDSLDAIDWNC